MDRSLQCRWLVTLTFIACQIGVSSASAQVAGKEKRIREQLALSTQLDCKLFPLPGTIEYLADFHDIPISLDLLEIKKIGIDLGPSQVTKKTTGRLDDTLTEILGPFNLSFMIEGGELLITSQPKARAWQEKYANSRR